MLIAVVMAESSLAALDAVPQLKLTAGWMGKTSDADAARDRSAKKHRNPVGIGETNQWDNPVGKTLQAIAVRWRLAPVDLACSEKYPVAQPVLSGSGQRRLDDRNDGYGGHWRCSKYQLRNNFEPLQTVKRLDNFELMPVRRRNSERTRVRVDKMILASFASLFWVLLPKSHGRWCRQTQRN